MIKEVYIKITGRVQGVGYRAWAVAEAEKISGISGWVRNAHDGSVEIFMRGEEEKIDQMIVACQQGPRWGKVDKVEFISGRLNGFLPIIEDGVFKRVY